MDDMQVLPFGQHLSVLNDLFTTRPDIRQVLYGERFGAVDKPSTIARKYGIMIS